LIAFFFYLKALDAQLHVLHQTVNSAATTVNARGALLVELLQDIPNRVREIAGHGVCQGAEIALATVQTQLDVRNIDCIPQSLDETLMHSGWNTTISMDPILA
jgi:hypothetical protein